MSNSSNWTTPAGAGTSRSWRTASALVLNDRRTGMTWAASADYELINNWDELIDTRTRRGGGRAERSRHPAHRSRRARCRRSRSTTSSALGPGGRRCSRCSSTTTTRTATCSSWTRSSASCRVGARLDLVADNQQLQLTLGAEASGAIGIRLHRRRRPGRDRAGARRGHGPRARREFAPRAAASDERAPSARADE